MQEWTWTYRQQDEENYYDSARRGRYFPACHRFTDCDHVTGLMKLDRMQRQRFAPMFVVRELLHRNPQLEVWQERYKLALDKPLRTSKYFTCNREIADRLGRAVKSEIQVRGLAILPKFKDPDVVTFDPVRRFWQFIEVKRRAGSSVDGWQPGQENSLLLL